MKSQDFLWHTLPIETVLAELSTNPETGLATKEAGQRRAECGPNELEERSGKSPFRILLEQFTSTMVLILIVAALASALLGKPLETIAISAIVVFFGILGFVQEYRAEQAIVALKKLTVPSVRVIRNGETLALSAHELVPGDVVILEAGNVVPADLRLIAVNSLMVQEAALTGESEPVTKQTAPVLQDNPALGDRLNMTYMGTTVTYGRGTGVVIGTGMRTELGRIAKLIGEVETQPTPLQQQLEQVGRILALAGTLVALLVLVIGVLMHEPLSDMLLTAVSVAVAVVPEGLPAVVTITLALGAQRMLRRKALIRKLPAVETLGSVDVICSDKTGTLTENRMTVTILDVAGHSIELQGMGKTDAVKPSAMNWVLENEQASAVSLLLVSGALCNDAVLSAPAEGERQYSLGDPTEGALVMAALQAGMRKDELEKILPRAAEKPFDSERKRMTTVHQLPDPKVTLPPFLTFLRAFDTPYLSLTKGSLDGMLACATHIWVKDKIETLDAHWLETLQADHDKMAGKGMRVLAIAIRPHQVLPDTTGSAVESELILVGLAGMIDPPRPEVKAAIRRCREAGIRPLMITGDHPLTARFIAHELGINDNPEVVTGQMLEMMDEEALRQVVSEVSVYARVAPEHKLRIVRALQARGSVVAMTGDGVNDSPALRKADIGVAMGITGTDVSKEAAQMVLLDDNFTTIIAAVEEGRTIYENIRRFVKFSVAGNFGKVLVMLLAPLMGISVALQPLQLLWLNLLTDGLMGLGIGMEPADKSVMQTPPRRKQAPFFDRALIGYIVGYGVLIGLIALLVGWWYYSPTAPKDRVWQTMIFTALAFMRIGQALGSRSDRRSFFSLGLMSNPTLLIMAALAFVMQLGAVYLPFLDEFFKITPLSAPDLLICVGLGVFVFAVMELKKVLLRR